MRERIQQKAEELFHRYGIRSITMDEIAAQLGISKKTIYQSFSDKDELVTAVFDKHMVENKEKCLADREKSKDAIHEIFLDLELMGEMLKAMNPYVMYDLEKYHPNVFKKFIDYKNKFLYKLLNDNLKRGIEEEVYRADINVDIMSRLRLGTIMLSMNMDIFPRGQHSVLEIEEEIIIHFLYGIASAKGVKLIQKYKAQRNKTKLSDA